MLCITIFLILSTKFSSCKNLFLSNIFDTKQIENGAKIEILHRLFLNFKKEPKFTSHLNFQKFLFIQIYSSGVFKYSESNFKNKFDYNKSLKLKPFDSEYGIFNRFKNILIAHYSCYFCWVEPKQS